VPGNSDTDACPARRAARQLLTLAYHSRRTGALRSGPTPILEHVVANPNSCRSSDGPATDTDGIEPHAAKRSTKIHALAGRWCKTSSTDSRGSRARPKAVSSLLSGTLAADPLPAFQGGPHLIIHVSGSLVKWISSAGVRSLVLDDSVSRIDESGIARWTCRWHGGRLLVVTRFPRSVMTLESIELFSSGILKHSVTLSIGDESWVDVAHFARAGMHARSTIAS
jgi:hypothetical protein